MGGGGRSSSNTSYNSQSNVYQNNLNEQRNNIHTNTKNEIGDTVNNRDAFKIAVMGDVGS